MKGTGARAAILGSAAVAALFAVPALTLAAAPRPVEPAKIEPRTNERAVTRTRIGRPTGENLTNDAAAATTTVSTVEDANPNNVSPVDEIIEEEGADDKDEDEKQPDEKPEDWSEPVPLVMRDPAGPDTVAGEVVFLSRASNAQLDALIAERGFALVGRDRLASLGLVMVTARLKSGDERAEILAELGADSRVAWAQPNHIYWLLAGEDEARPASSRDRGLAMHSLDRQRPAIKGAIALIDGPVDLRNAALAGANVTEELYGEDGTPSPHGTAIAELLVGTGAFAGVAQGARLLSLPAFRPVGIDGWQSTTRHVARALDRAVTVSPQVLNLSFGTRAVDRTARELLLLLEEGGTCIAAAAGNGGGDVLFPATLPQTLAVTAVDGARALYPHASRGPQVDVAAWGVMMSAAVPGGRRNVSGTSFATAVVAGSMMHMPACNGGRAPAIMREAARGDALDMGDSGRDSLFGAGLFQLGTASLAAVSEDAERTDSSEPAPQAQGQPETAPASSWWKWALLFGVIVSLWLFFLFRKKKEKAAAKR